MDCSMEECLLFGSSLAKPDQFLPCVPWRVMRFVRVAIFFGGCVEMEEGGGSWGGGYWELGM